jgi:hypothetical protein
LVLAFPGFHPGLLKVNPFGILLCLIFRFIFKFSNFQIPGLEVSLLFAIFHRRVRPLIIVSSASFRYTGSGDLTDDIFE